MDRDRRIHLHKNGKLAFLIDFNSQDTRLLLNEALFGHYEIVLKEPDGTLQYLSEIEIPTPLN